MRTTSFTRLAAALLLCATALLAHAAATSNSAISDEPLGTGTGVSVKPNIYYLFDDSGSMGWNYLPDHVNDKYCFGGSKVSFGNLTNDTSSPPSIRSSTSGDIATCAFGDPPYNSSSFNFIAYNPSIRYLPPTQYDGTLYPSMTSANTSGWTVVPDDAFGRLTTANTDLVTGFPDKKWCNGTSTTDCRTNVNGYQYPDLVKYTSSKSINGSAYYYNMATAWYCTDYTGTNCVPAPNTTTNYCTTGATPNCMKSSSTTYTQPFRQTLWCASYSTSTKIYSSCQATQDSTHGVSTEPAFDAATYTQPFAYLWCTSYTANATTNAPVYANCQSLRDGTHTVPTYLGKTVAVTAVTATGGSITVSPAASYDTSQIAGITIGGTPLITAPIIGTTSDTANTLATAICTQVSANKIASGYDCPVAPTGATASLTATATGSAYNGAIIVQGPSSAHTYTRAIGSFQVNTPLTTSMKADSIFVGTTQLLAGGATVTAATATQYAYASAFCTQINANTAASQYTARVVSAPGAATPAWSGSAAARCTPGSGTYVEIASLINSASENGKAISISGPAATSASAGIAISGGMFATGTRPGNLGAITAAGPITLFNSIPTTSPAIVPNSNSLASIDAGLRSRWAAPSGYTMSGPVGLITITAPAGSGKNGTTVSVAPGTNVGFVAATTSITFSATAKNKILKGLTCNGVDIIPPANYSTGGSSTSSTWPKALATAVNANGGANGYTVSCPSGGSLCNITAPAGAAACTVAKKTGSDSTISFSGGVLGAGSPSTNDNLLPAISTPITFNNAGTDGAIPVTGVTALAGFTDIVYGAIATTTTPFIGGTDAKQRTEVGLFSRVDIIDDGRSFVKGTERDDCTGSACTYAEEMTNFANWYAYYGTRCDLMKSSVMRAFAPLGGDFRVGFNDIYDADHLDVNDFYDVATANIGVAGAPKDPASNKGAWYAKLKSKTCGVGGTPLQRGLSAAGRYYAGKIHTTTDPIQYSCQKNFTILSTDGYWNNNLTNTPVDANGTTIGDVDSTAGINTANTLPNKPMAPYRDDKATAGTLADVAKWYYDHDLRNGPDSINDAAHGWGTVPGTAQAHYSNADVHATDSDPATWQHMVTFTLGLGMDGLLHYNPNYLTGASPDYEALKAGTKSWGVPGANKQENVDDLWHAAVNGHGQYFSARDPTQLVSSFSTALTAISGVLGAASASATSNMEPVAGDNYLYAASYTTQDWTGDLESRTISVASATAGQVSTTTLWSAQAKLDARTTSRLILTYDSAGTGAYGKGKILNWANLSSAEQAYFDITQMSGYVAGGTLPTNADCNTAGSTAGNDPTKCKSLLDYLTGATTGTAAAFRTRRHLLGDTVNTQPIFIGAPTFAYNDPGYSSFKPTRSKAVYVSANDGMVHAFDGDGTTGGSEKWAYVPSFVLPNLWQIADTNYANHHKYFVDGPLTAGDVYINGEWRTVLVGGLAKGGRGYFALDVTDPDNPKVLWEVSRQQMGYSYGNPVITKLADGTWVVIVSTGYDNVPAANGGITPSGDGGGYIYILDMATGAGLYRLDTGDGTVTDPANIGKITAWVSDAMHDNTALFVYAGDMHGNLWRFTLPTATSTSISILSGYPSVLKLFAAPTGQMITVKPEISKIDGTDTHRMVFFGTGRYLSLDDKSDLNTQSIYGLYDDDAVTSSTTMPVKTDLVQQTLCGQGLPASVNTSAPCNTISPMPTTYRTTTQNAVTLGLGTGQKRGWYVDLPDKSVGSERISVDPVLQLGTLTVASNVPTSSDCNAGGYSWVYYLNYKTGSYIATTDTATVGLAGKMLANALVVGVTVVRIGDKLVALATTSDKKYPSDAPPIGATGGAQKRVGWRELITE